MSHCEICGVDERYGPCDCPSIRAAAAYGKVEVNKGVDEGSSRCADAQNIINKTLSFSEYQELAYKRIKNHKTLELARLNWAIGVGEEAGEVLSVIKHDIFGGEKDVELLAKEVGDVIWYLSALCKSYGLTLEGCAKINIAKLEHRHGGSSGFNFENNKNRHQLEEKFQDTDIYKELIKQTILTEV